jgi:hypothetical protein
LPSRTQRPFHLLIALDGWHTAFNAGVEYNVPPMPPKLNRQRALFVLTKIDEILAWEQGKQTERDTKFRGVGTLSLSLSLSLSLFLRSEVRAILASGEMEIV